MGLAACSPGVLHAQGARSIDRADFVVAVEHVFDDGESGVRVGGWWFVHDAVALGASGRWWSNYAVVEPELQWYPLGSSGIPFVSVAGVFQEHADITGRGVAVWVGAHTPFPPFPILGATAGLGWRFLFRDETADNHWFRLRVGLSLRR